MNKYMDALKALVNMLDIEVEDEGDYLSVTSYGCDCEVHDKKICELLREVFLDEDYIQR